MGWFTRNRTPPRQNPDELREALFAAVEAGDRHRLFELSERYAGTIKQHFPTWKLVPEAVRSDPQKVHRYAKGIIGVAQLFMERGDRSLIGLLQGPPADNPMVRWQDAVRSGEELIAARHYAQAEPSLRTGVTEGRDLSGPGVDRYLPVMLGLLGQCRFHQGDAHEAIGLFGEALAICRRTQDVEGEIAYLLNLHEAYRWLGHGAAAIDLAEQLAARCDNSGDQDRRSWAVQRVSRMLAGEPPVRVVAEIDGRRFELDELSSTPRSVSVRFYFERNRISLGSVTALVEEGSRLGSAGDYQGALAAFQTAAAMDPWDPQPPYLAGLALLEIGRYAEAMQAYDMTEWLAPGWFHCRADRWLAAELAESRLSHDGFAAVRKIQDGGATLAEQARLAAAALAVTPGVPVLYLLRAKALIALGSPAIAEGVARMGLERNPDPDVRTRLLVTLSQVAEPAECRRLLEEAVALDGNKVAAATARLMLLVEP